MGYTGVGYSPSLYYILLGIQIGHVLHKMQCMMLTKTLNFTSGRIKKILLS